MSTSSIFSTLPKYVLDDYTARRKIIVDVCIEKSKMLTDEAMMALVYERGWTVLDVAEYLRNFFNREIKELNDLQENLGFVTDAFIKLAIRNGCSICVGVSIPQYMENEIYFRSLDNLTKVVMIRVAEIYR